jgi:putative tricarboxylic transport membrane protein
MSEGPRGSDTATGAGQRALRQRSAELVVAGIFLLLGAIVIYDSVRLGARWGDDGPQAGYFPFYIGVLVCAASLINMLIGFLKVERDKVFVELAALKLVLSVLIPAAIYVALITWLGIYLASALFVAFFMRWLGKYVWWKVAAVSIGNSVVFFIIFEIWFKVPLPKGPLESLLGLN